MKKPSSKPPLVLLTGLSSDCRLWEHQVKNLGADLFIHVISAIQNTPEKMVESILQEVPERFSLAGHSMGGWLCLEVMRVAASRVSRLCLLNTTARMDSKEKRKSREEMICKVREGRFNEVAVAMADHFVYNSHVKTKIENMFLEVGKEIFINQQQAMMARKECESVLHTIACPTLVIHAAQDKNFSLEEHQELVDRIPYAELAIVENSGHMSPMEAPEAITGLLREWFCLESK